MKYEKCKVVILPTKKASPLVKNLEEELEYDYFLSTYGGVIQQHLYILSNEETKEDDWCIIKYHAKQYPFKIKSIKDGYVNFYSNKWIILDQPLKDCQKIIATTDSELGYYTEEQQYGYDPRNKTGGWKSLPRPFNEFIKAYCEQGGIDEVLVEYEYVLKYPKLERDYYLKVAPDNTITIKPIKNSWNREEVIKLVSEAFETGAGGMYDTYTRVNISADIKDFINKYL